MVAKKQLGHSGIARIWRGRTTHANADVYMAYLYDRGVRKLESLGARGVQMFRENRQDDVFFVVISYWDEREAMTRWAGDDPTQIRHLERDGELLIELPTSVQILDIVSNNWMLSDVMRG